MSFLSNIMPKNGLQVVMVLSITAIMSKDFVDRSGPFTDSYMLDLVWIGILAIIYLLYVKEDVWRQVSLLESQFKSAQNAQAAAQLASTLETVVNIVSGKTPVPIVTATIPPKVNTTGG